MAAEGPAVIVATATAGTGASSSRTPDTAVATTPLVEDPGGPHEAADKSCGEQQMKDGAARRDG